MAKRKQSLAAGLTQAVGGALVGVDQQIFRATPRVEERFKQRDEVSLAASDGGTLVIEVPADVEFATARESEPTATIPSRPTRSHGNDSPDVEGRTGTTALD